MISFLEYLTEANRGRKSLSKTRDSDAEFVRKEFNYNDTPNMTNAIRMLRKKYMTALQNNDIQLAKAEDMSLAELNQLVKKNKIVLPKRTRNWFIHEKDLVDGINALFKSGFFKVNGKQLIDNSAYYAEQVGGSSQSDVKVCHKDRSFFVECKLNLDTAEYFKFGLKIVGNQISYDHKKFLQGDIKHDKAQVERIDKLFKEDVNIGQFLNDLVKDKQIKAYWKQFLDNLRFVRQKLEKDDEFKQFSKQRSRDVFPDGFKDLADVFDEYCKYYIDKYNELIDQSFELFTYDEIKLHKDDYKIKDRKKEDVVFMTVNKLLANVKIAEDELGEKIVTDKKQFDNNIIMIKTIERKLNALIKSQGMELDSFSNLKQLKNINKMMYFFKLFLSSTGRKTKNGVALLNAEHDELGNMKLCPTVTIESDKLAKMIVDYYVKKDNCAYIQIADTILQLDKNWNPFNIPNLPLFTEAATQFNVSMLVNDNVTHISLHISAFKLNDKVIKQCNKLSFKKNDANWLKTKLKKIEIKTT